MPDIPLNPDAPDSQVSVDQRVEVIETPARDYPSHGAVTISLHHSERQSTTIQIAERTAESLRDQLNDHLAAALTEVTSVEQWDALPIGTMVRVHFNGNSELVIRCPAGSGAGIGSMSFLGGRHWSDVFTGWNTDKLEIKYIPEVKP